MWYAYYFTPILNICFILNRPLSTSEHIESQCTTKKNHERCLDIAAEAIFLDKRKGQPNIMPLSTFQEFQLVLVFAEFFSRPGPDVVKNAVFLCLFGEAQLPPGRSRVLSRFVSAAITDSVAPVISICAHLKRKRLNFQCCCSCCNLFVSTLNRFYARLAHGCNKLDQVHSPVSNWPSN